MGIPNKILKKMGKGRKRKPVRPYRKVYVDVCANGPTFKPSKVGNTKPK